MDGASLLNEAETFGLHLSRTQLEAFSVFEKRLYRANEKMNLTAVPEAECWKRHFLDCLSLSPLIPKGANVLDVGSGPGFPGAVLAIARPDLKVTCLDSSSKAVSFMQSVFGSDSPLPVLFEILHARAEELSHNERYREQYQFVTSRATARFAILVEICAAFAAVGGKFVPMRTPAERSQIAESQAAAFGLRLVEFQTIRIAPLDADRLLPIFEKVGRTPPRLPRKWAQIKSG